MNMTEPILNVASTESSSNYLDIFVIKSHMQMPTISKQKFTNVNVNFLNYKSQKRK